jgi:hypothetical protein
MLLNSMQHATHLHVPRYTPTPPVYLSGALPPALVVYSTRHTCMLPVLLPLATDWSSSQAASDMMAPPCRTAQGMTRSEGPAWQGVRAQHGKE